MIENIHLVSLCKYEIIITKSKGFFTEKKKKTKQKRNQRQLQVK